jgi:hypothetical protein
MAKPVNAMTGDAPDGQNPNKKYVPEKQGRFKYTPPPPPKPDPRDAEIFTEEKLRRSGGKMKEPPMGLDSKKRGGVIKRRFASGGEIMDEYDGAIGRGTDTPDRKIAREKSDAAYESDAADKTAGLKASKGEDVGFFKRLMMGNIDKPGSEAYEKFGAGRGRADTAREDANKSARNERENARTREANMALDENTPAPVKTKPSVDNNPIATGYTNRLEKEERNAETELTSAERANAMRPNRVAATVKPTVTKPIGPVKRPVKDPTAGEAKEGAAAQLAADKQGDAAPAASNKINSVEVPAAPKVKAETDGLPTLDRNGPTPKSTGYQGGPNELEKIIQGIPGGGASLAGIAALASASGVGAAKLYKMYKAAQRAKDAAAAARFSQPGAREVTKDLSKYTGKEELEAAESAMRGANSRRGIQKRNPSSKVEYKRGGNIKAYASGGSVSASSRGDGCAQRGKTRGTMR